MIETPKDRHLPSLYQSANQSSLSAQRTYLCFQICHLSSLILGSVTAMTIPLVPATYLTWLYGGMAIIFTVGVILTLISHSLRNDKIWFDCRAIAESTKTAAWRFMMKAAPFEDNGMANQQFTSKLREIREARSSNPKHLAGNLNASAQAISDFMNNVRAKDLDDRKTFYIESRLRDQKAWYSKKANCNSRNESCWFWTTTMFQILAVVLAIVQATSGGFPVNVLPFLVTCAASAVAWSQMRRHGELAQTYSLAAQELGEQEAIAINLTEEADFLSFVEQVEETISREHIMWCARRNTVISPTNKGV